MASATAGRGYRQNLNSRSPNPRHGFAESNPRIRIELQKSKIQLERELKRLERQSKAETNYISTHQQAIKMNFRRLEQKRKQDSPPVDRSGTREKDAGARRGIFYSKTPMSVDATAAIYATETSKPAAHMQRSRTVSASDIDDLSVTSSEPNLELLLPAATDLSLPMTQSAKNLLSVKNSPYVTSPFNLRRAAKSGNTPLVTLSSPQLRRNNQVPHPLTKMATFPEMQKPQSASKKAVSIEEHPLDISTLETKVKNLSIDSMSALHPSAQMKRSALKLPPLESSGTRSEVLVAHSNTIDKETLLKAANMMKTSGGSHGPNAFHQFYSASDSRRSSTELGSKILLSPAVEDERSLGSALPANYEEEKKNEEEEEEEKVR